MDKQKKARRKVCTNCNLVKPIWRFIDELNNECYMCDTCRNRTVSQAEANELIHDIAKQLFHR